MKTMIDGVEYLDGVTITTEECRPRGNCRGIFCKRIKETQYEYSCKEVKTW